MDKTKRLEVNKLIGRACAKWRRGEGISQLKVACDLGMSMENVSAFERGINDSVYIFAWYLSKGFDPHESVEVWQAYKSI